MQRRARDCNQVMNQVGRLVGAVGIEFTSPQSKSRKRNGVVPPPLFNWSLLDPSRPAEPDSTASRCWFRATQRHWTKDSSAGSIYCFREAEQIAAFRKLAEDSGAVPYMLVSAVITHRPQVERAVAAGKGDPNSLILIRY